MCLWCSVVVLSSVKHSSCTPLTSVGTSNESVAILSYFVAFAAVIFL